MSSITEGMYKAQVLTETRTYKLWESAGQKIMEAQLTADQINQLFANIEQGATAAGGNRTVIGKGKDVASAVNKAWEDLKTKASNSGPIKNMDAMYDEAAEKLKQATGGDQGVMKYVQKYRDFAKKHPVAQSLIYGALIAAAGITGAGVGGAAALGLFKMVDKLLQGEKFSSAAYSGAKTGALAYGASKVGDLIRGNQPAANMKTTASGERSWSTDGSRYTTNAPGMQGTAAGRMAAMRAKYANESIELNEATIALLFTRIDEGLWDTIKGKAQQAGAAVSAKAQQVGKNLTTKVTADKLMKMWKAEGSPTDSKQLVFFLTQKAGVDKGVVDKVFADMKIVDTPAQGQQAPAQPAAPKQAAPKQVAPRAAKPAAPTPAAGNAPVAGVRQQGGTFAAKSLYKEGSAADDSAEFKHKVSNIIRQNPKGSASEKMILNRFLATPMVQDFNLKGREWIDQAHEWLQTVKKDLQKKYPEADLSDLEELAHKMYEDYLARIGELEEGYSAGAAGGAGLGEEVDEGQIYSTGGGAGQSYRKFKPKSGGIAESLLEYKLPYKMGKQDSDMQQIDNMIAQLPDGLDVSRVWYFAKDAFKRLNPKMNYQQQKEEFDKLKYGFYDVYKKTHKEKSLLDKAKDMVGLDEGGYGYELNELKCWPGYTRVRGVPAGAPGSCKKKTKESGIMKGIQNEEQVDEYKEIEGQRKIEFSKENPPDLYYLYQQFIQRMLNPDNTIDPNEWIDKVNKHYGLNYTWKDYQKRGHNDHTNNWQKIVDKYILKK